MPTVADIAPICALLTHLTTGEPLRSGALTCILLLTSGLADPDWLTLTDARDAAVVTEVDQDGVVSALSVTNRAHRPLLLLDGEELVGAKQNRVLNTTVLVAAGSQLTIPVSCVEQGRWQRRGERFAPGNASLYASLRARKAARVSESLGRARGHGGDQHELWAALRAKAEARDVTSPTDAMSDVYAHDRQKIEKVRETLAPLPGQTGALVYASGRWLGLDVLACPTVFTRVWPRLCAGYAADAVTGHEAECLDPRPSEVLDRLLLATATQAPAVGLGVEYRLAADGLTGTALAVEDLTAHLMAFALPSGTEK
jgi:hypothetical protein